MAAQGQYERRIQLQPSKQIRRRLVQLLPPYMQDLLRRVAARLLRSDYLSQCDHSSACCSASAFASPYRS
jgi:hypothetical protein